MKKSCEHPSIGDALTSMTVLWYKLKDLPGAVERLELAVNMFENVCGKKHPRTIQLAEFL